MEKELGMLRLVTIALVTIIIIMSAKFIFVAPAQCKSRWENSGFSVKYTILGGCLVGKDDKTLLPEYVFRQRYMNGLNLTTEVNQ